MTTPIPRREDILDAMRTVIDPEIGIDIVELGLIYDVVIDDKDIRIDMTTTSPACPTGSLMRDEARAAVSARVPAGFVVEVRQVWDPPWEPSRMSETAKRTLGW